jgi:predicted MFS family arabinose efflux permease
MAKSPKLHPAIYLLSLTAFAIGVAEFIVVGVLNSIASDFAIPIEKAGSLVGLYALSLAIGTPIVTLMLSRFNKKHVLVALISFFTLGNLISAMANSFEVLLAGRIITAVAHGSFFAIGATVASGLAPKGEESKAIALMFAGLTIAMVIGVPLGSFIGNMAGWQWPFLAVFVLGVISLIATNQLLPTQASLPKSSVKTQLSALTNSRVLAMMLVTILGFGASFTAFTYITPIMIEVTGFTEQTASILLLVFGGATFIGNLAGGNASVRFGWHKTLQGNFSALALMFIVLLFAMQQKWSMAPALFVWGLLAFSLSPSLQTGMLKIASTHTPKAVNFTSALNIASFNFGIALGEYSGGSLIAIGKLSDTPIAGVVMVALAILPLAYISKQKDNTSP